MANKYWKQIYESTMTVTFFVVEERRGKLKLFFERFYGVTKLILHGPYLAPRTWKWLHVKPCFEPVWLKNPAGSMYETTTVNFKTS